jgi:8-oxo-dGTP diphosphatase
MPVGQVVAAVVVYGDYALVSRRFRDLPEWAFVGGKVKAGEPAEHAAEREVAEETGMRVTAGAVLGQRIHPVTETPMVYVSCWPAGPASVRPRPGSGLAEVGWVPILEAVQLMPDMYPPARRYLETRHRWQS